jgi:hypothetical protein
VTGEPIVIDVDAIPHTGVVGADVRMTMTLCAVGPDQVYVGFVPPLTVMANDPPGSVVESLPHAAARVRLSASSAPKRFILPP